EQSISNQAGDITSKYNAAQNNIEQQIKNRSESYNTRKIAFTTANQRSADLHARLEALGSISMFSFYPQNSDFLGNSIWWASFVITCLFIALETAPVVVKLLTK